MKTKKKIEDHMSGFPRLATPEMSVDFALEMMKRDAIRHLPVVDEGNVVGTVSEADLRNAAPRGERTVANVMRLDPYCVLLGTPLAEVTSGMASRKLDCAIVLGDFGRVVGIFTATDALRALSDVLLNRATDRSNAMNTGKTPEKATEAEVPPHLVHMIEF